MRATILAILSIFGYCQAQNFGTFRNPILNEVVRFPSVCKYQGLYYMVLAKGNRLEILRSTTLSNFYDAERRVIYQAPPDSINTQAPRIQQIRDNLYIYFSRDNITETNESHRLYVIKSLDPCNPLGQWSNETRLLPEDIAAHKGIVLNYNHDDLYFVWTVPQNEGALHNIFIASMESPMKVAGPRTLLRAPTMEWEFHQNYSGVNEGPFILQNRGATYLTFSAKALNNADYCLGIMGIHGGRDPTLPSNWWNDVNHCVFARNDEESVYGTGYASFVKSQDDTETWMVYQAWDSVGNITARIQKLQWGEMNIPIFSPARGLFVDLELPGGE